MSQSFLEFSEAAIFSRCVETERADLSPELARHILALRLSADGERRIDQLLPKAQAGTLTPEEQGEMEALNHIADLVSLWHSKARQALQQPAS